MPLIVQHVMGLAEAVVKLLFDDKLRLRLALQGRLTALEYTPEAIVQKHASDPLSILILQMCSTVCIQIHGAACCYGSCNHVLRLQLLQVFITCMLQLIVYRFAAVLYGLQAVLKPYRLEAASIMFSQAASCLEAVQAGC